MHVLVTGAGGFSGALVVKALLADGHRVSAVTGTNAGRLAQVAPAHERLAVLQGDLAAEIDLPPRLDAIVHAAARSPVPGMTDERMLRDNVVATERLVRHAIASGAQAFIFFSSLSVYGRVDVPVVDEATPINNPDFYGETKRRGEQLLQSEARRFRSLSLRLPGVIGPNSVRNWMTQVLEAAKAGKEISIYNAHGAFNNVVHVADLVAFVGNLLLRQWTGADTVTIAAAGQVSVQQAVRIVVDAFGGRSTIRSSSAKRPGFIVSSTRAEAVYGYRPMHIAEALKRFAAENR